MDLILKDLEDFVLPEKVIIEHSNEWKRFFANKFKYNDEFKDKGIVLEIKFNEKNHSTIYLPEIFKKKYKDLKTVDKLLEDLTFSATNKTSKDWRNDLLANSLSFKK